MLEHSEQTSQYYNTTQLYSMKIRVSKSNINHHTVFKELMFQVLGANPIGIKIDMKIFNELKLPCTIYDVRDILKKNKKASLYNHVVFIRNELNRTPSTFNEITEDDWDIMERRFVFCQPERKKCSNKYILHFLLIDHGYHKIAHENIFKNKKWCDYKLPLVD